MAGFFLGQRMGDLICLTWGAVDFDRNLVKLAQGKTGKHVQIPLRRELGQFLSELRREVGNVKPSDGIWPEQAARYEKQGAGGFSNEFYKLVLLAAGLVSARTHKKVKDREGKPAQRMKFHSTVCVTALSVF